jgi:A/G-specific adenine glycosylase
MYDLPLVETDTLMPIRELKNLLQVKEIFGPDIELSESLIPVHKHILTHQRLFLRLIKTPSKPLKLQPNWFYSSVENLHSFALPKAIFILVENIFNL